MQTEAVKNCGEHDTEELAIAGQKETSRIKPVRFRGIIVRIYRRSKSFPFYRIAYRADGGRVVRTFKTLAEARAAADAKARELHAGNDVGAALPKAAAADYKFALAKLRELQGCLTLADVAAEYIEAKRKVGSVRLVVAADAYISTAAKVKRIALKQASEEFLREREARTRPEKEGARPKLSPRMAYQDGLRIGRFRDAFQMDVCDLRPEHLDLFFSTHLKTAAARTRNHFRSTLSVFFKWCVRKSYLPEDHILRKSEGLRPDGKGKEEADVGVVEIYTPKELSVLLSHAEGPILALTAIGALAGLRTEELLRLDWADVWRRAGYIEVTGRKAKTRARRLIPIGTALAAWLAPFRKHAEGPLWPGKFVSYHEHKRT